VVATRGNSVYVSYMSTATTIVNAYNINVVGVSTSNIVVSAVGGQLIIGFGALAVAQYVTTLDGSVPAANVTDTSTAALYVYAIAQDRAAVYIAGGTATTNTNTVLSAATTAASPATSFAVAASAVTCTTTAQPITSLLSGGGISGILVFVGRTGELGFIDTSAVYHTLVPFESRLSTNCVGMKWFLPGTDTTDIGQILVFPVGRSIWSFNTAGQPMNMAPQGKAGFRPINARGVVTSIQPTTHFLYYGITNSSGNGFIIANDGVTGANHTYRYQGSLGGPTAMGVTSLFGTNPLLYFGNTSTAGGIPRLGYITLPADGDWPPSDTNCIYDTGTTNTLTLPDIDLGFPDEDKVPTFLRIVADNLVSGAQYITAAYATEGSSTYTTLGTYFLSPIQDIPFPSMTFKRMSLQLTFTTTDTTKTPVLNAVSMRSSLNPKQYTIWSMKAMMPTGVTMIGDSPYNANTVITALWAAYKAGTPVAYTDRWNKQWLVRILDFQEPETVEEALRTPETAMSLQLLELYATGLESAWDGANTIWDDPKTTWG
jgi:hypothetical protein